MAIRGRDAYAWGMPPRALPLRNARLIVLALALGILIASGVVVFLRLSNDTAMNPEIGKLLLVVIGGLALSNAVVYFLLRKSFVARAHEAQAEALELLKQDAVPPQLFTLTIIGSALAEGVGLLGVVAVLLGAPWFALAAPLVAVALILAQLPTRAKLERLVRGS